MVLAGAHRPRREPARLWADPGALGTSSSVRAATADLDPEFEKLALRCSRDLTSVDHGLCGDAGQGPVPPGNALLMGVMFILFIFAPPGRVLGFDSFLRGRLPGWMV